MRNEIKAITATDREIAVALKHASVPAVMMSMIQMSGETSLLEGPIRPRPAGMVETQGAMTAAERSVVLAEAVRVVAKYRDGGSDAAFVPEGEILERMMRFVVGGQPIPEELRPLLLEELAIDGEDQRRFEVDPHALREAEDFHVIIVGAGMSGLLIAVRLKQAGVPFTVLEKNDGVGGSWYENRYPGCRVDIASHSYSYSFQPGDWQHRFGEHSEVREYFSRVAREYDLLDSIVFEAEVSNARFDESDGRWTVEYQRRGETFSTRGKVVVNAVGQLNRAKIPEVEGRERFDGPQMHTSAWDAAVDLEGKRVAVVGSGASAFQLVPELAKTAKHVSVFQRTPPWMFPNPAYHEPIAKEHQWCFKHLPGYERWYRFLTFWPMADKTQTRLAIDPDWDDGGLSCGAENKLMRDELTAWISGQVNEPGLLEKVIPAYPPFGTRTLQDNGNWLTALQRDNVDLIAEAVDRVTEAGVVAAGNEYEVDVIVWATGFHADRFFWPMEIEGRGGASLSREWQDVPKAYLGICLPSFPNFFCVYGPNTNVAHTGNVIFISECQTSYILDAIRLMIEDNLQSFECRRDVADEYEARLADALTKSVWSHSNVRSFYRNQTGRVVVNMPWKIADYWKWTRRVHRDDFIASPVDEGNP